MLQSRTHNSARSVLQIDPQGKIVFSDQWAVLSSRSSNRHAEEHFSLAKSSGSWSPQLPVGIVRFGRLFGEEDQISGSGPDAPGTGAIYVHGCQLRCKHCYQPEFFAPQANCYTDSYSLADLLKQFESAQVKTALLVVSHFQSYVLKSIQQARHMGVRLPIVYKHSGLLSQRQINELAPWINLFLPDIKALSQEFALSQGLHSKTPEMSLASLKYSIAQAETSGTQVIARYLLIPTYQHHLSELQLLVDGLGPLASSPRFSLSLLTLFQDPETGMITRVSPELLEACHTYLDSKSVSVISDLVREVAAV